MEQVSVLVLSDIGDQNRFVRRSDAWLATQDVDDEEDDDHQDGDPNRHFPKRAKARHTPVQRKTLGAGETGAAISASLRLKRTDAATFRAGFGIEPLRHKGEIACARKNFQWYERDGFAQFPPGGTAQIRQAGGHTASGAHYMHIGMIHLFDTLVV